METSKQIGVRVPASINKRLAVIARRENNRISSVMRRLLTSALDQEEAVRAEPTKRPGRPS